MINKLIITIVGEQKDQKEKNNKKQTNRDVLHWVYYYTGCTTLGVLGVLHWVYYTFYSF